MNRLFCWWIILLAAIFIQRGLSVPAATEVPDEDDDDDFDEDDESSEVDDDSRIYKNPRNSPSVDCPRDEEQATLLGQKCLRKCSSDEDCKSKKKKCLCDGACGMSCIKPDRECPELPQPELGAVTISGREFGGRATYTCPHGFHVVGLQSRLCRNGQWTGSEPTCTKNIFCLQPPVIEHARHSALPEQTSFELDSTVQYHCHTGYVTAGFPRAKCLAIDGRASWYGPDIQCEPRSCDQPAEPSHGWHAGECYTFGCRITYHCNEGYELVGKTEKFCQAQGDWAPKELPTCVLVTSVQCPTPESPKNGRAIFTSVSYNSIVSYECQYGFTLVGESSRRCGADRKWSSVLPVCKEINCGHPGVLYNGWLENIDAGTGLGASIIFRCHPGMLLMGNTTTLCQVDGRWRYPVPQCLAPCVLPTISQGTVMPIERELDANMTAIPPTTNKVQHGTTLEVMCEDHYEFPILSTSPPTCNNGTWSIIPRCTPARCRTLPKPPKFGMVLAPKTEHGMKARFKCKDGFNLTGPGGKEITNENDYVLTCSFGNWIGQTPMCQELYCSFPGYVKHGKVLLVGNMGLYDYRPYVKKIVNNKQIMYDCDKGYILSEKGPVGATCVGGVWRPTILPACQPGVHPRLRWNRKKRSLQMKATRSQFVMKNYRNLKRKVDELLRETRHHSPFHHQQMKRSTFNQRHDRSFADPVSRRKLYLSNIIRRKRNNRQLIPTSQLTDMWSSLLYNNRHRRNQNEDPEVNYLKYIDKIRQKHRNYISNLFRMSHSLVRNSSAFDEGDSMRNGHSHSERVKPFSIYDRLPHTVNNPVAMGAEDEVEPVESGNLPRLSNIQEVDPILFMPIPLPNINQGMNHAYAKKEIIEVPFIVNNTYLGNNRGYQTDRNVPDRPIQSNNFFDLPDLHEKQQNRSSIIAQLKSQILQRRKRDTAGENANENNSRKSSERFNSNHTLLQDDEAADNERKSRAKEPCEPIKIQSYMRIDIVREGKDPNNEFGFGTVIRATCAKEYRLNLQNPNGTAKCVRGRWKPARPECYVIPCSVPSVEHGKFSGIYVDTSKKDSKPVSKPLNAFDEVQSGEYVEFVCDDGYNTQGLPQMKCVESNWDAPSLPECIPAPCLLPIISNAAYQGGYRAGLTIAHGSFVTVQCEKSGSQSVQMDCALGSLAPKTIQCSPSARKSREEYLGEIEFISSNPDIGGLLSAFDQNYQGNGDTASTETSVLMGSYSKHYYGSGKPCGLPIRDEDAMVYKNGEVVAEIDEGFDSGTEITFNCIVGAGGVRTTWKIICDNGAWIGRSENCANRSCDFYENNPNVVSFYNNLLIRETNTSFAAGAVIVSRCVDIGKFSMLGSNVRTCLHSEWTGLQPVCHGLNQENDYDMGKAPTILFRHSNGPIAQSNDGKLIVYPGATVHMECLWMKKFGNPKWVTNNSSRVYPEGWTNDEGRDPTLEYRLSIVNAVDEDTGVYTCQTPARHEHSIEVIVKPVKCPEIISRRGLRADTNDTKLGAVVHFSCINGNTLIGTSSVICTPNGSWNATLPLCEAVQCGDIPLPASSNRSVPRPTVLSREVGSQATFSCRSGYGLKGPSETTCLSTGEWSLPFPTCQEVQCEAPGNPINGYAQGSSPYRAGDVVQFNCNPEYMMQGQPIIACQDNGRWSSVIPKCVQACSYPGTTIAGRMSSVKFYYSIGETITFTCDAGLELKGPKMLKCLRNAKWSSTIPTCVSSDQE